MIWVKQLCPIKDDYSKSFMCLRFKVNYRIRFIISFDFESICTRELDKLLQATQSYLMISQEYVLDVFVYS